MTTITDLRANASVTAYIVALYTRFRLPEKVDVNKGRLKYVRTAREAATHGIIIDPKHLKKHRVCLSYC